MRRTLVEGGAPQPPAGASVLSRYITRVRNSFQNLAPPIPETPELVMPGMMEAQESQELGQKSVGGAQEPASGEPGPSSPAHVLVHREQEPEGIGELALERDVGATGEP